VERQRSEKSKFFRSSGRLSNTRLKATLISIDKNNSLVLEGWKKINLAFILLIPKREIFSRAKGSEGKQGNE